MGREHPRRGSLQFWPRSRAKRIYARVNNYPVVKDATLLGFAGYKAGMTHVILTDNRPKALTKGEEVMWAVTVVECPPLKVAAVRFCKKDRVGQGSHVVTEVRNGKLDKELDRKLNLSKKPAKSLADVNVDYDFLRLLVYTQPKKSAVGKKTPEVFELAVGGDKAAQLKFAQDHMDKEIPLSTVFKAGQQVDVHAITKGHGFKSSVKRFGVALKSHKSEKKKRTTGNLGPWHPAKISFHVPQPGQTGYHTRTEYNKQLLLVSNETARVNPRGGFVRYGNVQSEFLLIKGSLPGPAKRLIRMQFPIRPNKKIPEQAPNIEFISLEAKQ